MMIETSNASLQLAEIRHALLLALGQLGQPEYALGKLAEFKSDILMLGIPATCEKWGQYLRQLAEIK